MDALTRFSQANRYMEFPLKLAIEFLLTLPGTSGAQLFAKEKLNENNAGAQTWMSGELHKATATSNYSYCWSQV
jgi:hypothetical protein